MVRPWGFVVMLFTAVVVQGGCHGVSENELAAIERALGLEAGATIADVGTGDGDYLPFYARLAGEDGWVLGTEIDPELLTSLERRIAGESWDNVRIVQATAESTGLAERCCEAVVLRHVYHHLTQPHATLEDLHRALRPGGTLLVIDFQPTRLLWPWTPEDLPEDRTGHGITPAVVSREAMAAGFVSAAELADWPDEHWFMDRFAVVLKKSDGG